MKLVKIFSIAAASLLLVAACGPRTPKLEGSEEALALLPAEGLTDSASYLYGVWIGYQIKNNFGTLNMSEFNKGLDDIFKTKDRLNVQDSSFLAHFKIDLNKTDSVLSLASQKFAAYKAKRNEEEGAAYMQDFLKKNKDVADSTASGLVFLIQDSGAQERVTDDRDTVKVSFRYTHLDGAEIEKVEDAFFPLDGYGLISGLKEGLKLVGEGGKITLVVPSKLAYPNGYYGGIEPNETLIYDVDLKEVHHFEDKPANE
ncbi:MAG: FKBP-type peptidyl-prolyl cis-trans isomerase [Bacteroidales bacterium]|nr:FKBP-type peptidyl-prolyl cis-trans isomerase [Bacteroidales bacterium]